jgi:C-terminal processing protease CtpA/Prc
LSINGERAGTILAKLKPVMSVDGRTEASRLAKLEADGDLMGSGFDHFYPVHFGFPSAWALEVLEPGAAKPRSLTAKPLSFSEWQALPWTSIVKGDEFYKSISWRLAGKNALLRVDTFVNYRNPVDAMRFYSAFFAQLKDAKTEHLLIDLRHTGGGSDDAATALAAHVLEGEFTYTKPSLQRAIRFGDWQQHVQTWGDRKALFAPPESDFRKLPESGFYERVEPAKKYTAAPDRFGGKVTVLTGPRNASGATMLIAKLKDAKRVTLVGEATGGSAEGPTAGRMFFVKLPASGIVARIPVQWNRMEIGTFAPGLGVAPDVEVSPSLTDWLAGKDPALDVALGRPR